MNKLVNVFPCLDNENNTYPKVFFLKHLGILTIQECSLHFNSTKSLHGPNASCRNERDDVVYSSKYIFADVLVTSYKDRIWVLRYGFYGPLHECFTRFRFGNNSLKLAPTLPEKMQADRVEIEQLGG